MEVTPCIALTLHADPDVMESLLLNNKPFLLKCVHTCTFSAESIEGLGFLSLDRTGWSSAIPYVWVFLPPTVVDIADTLFSPDTTH